MAQIVHVLAGKFDSREAACLYTEEQWEPELGETASDEECEAWEERNPTWAMLEDLSTEYLDGDFIETIAGETRVAYLERMLLSDADRLKLRESVSDTENILVLIFKEAFGGFAASMCSTPRLRYLGAFRCNVYAQ